MPHSLAILIFPFALSELCLLVLVVILKLTVWSQVSFKKKNNQTEQSQTFFYRARDNATQSHLLKSSFSGFESHSSCGICVPLTISS